jgi:HlyD family secretion protein
MRKSINHILVFIRKQPRWRLIVAGVILFIGVIWMFSGGDNTAANSPTFAARRGPLDVTVLEGGSLQALESQELKCEVRVGYQGVKILRIVEEGYFVTDEDVRNRKILVELDSSEIQKQIVQQEIQYQSALASLTDAEQNYEIQLGQNQSDIKAAEQKTRFARLDFDKFLSDSVTRLIVEEVGLEALLEAATTNNIQQTSHAEELANAAAQTASVPSIPPRSSEGSAVVDAATINIVLSREGAAIPGDARDALPNGAPPAGIAGMPETAEFTMPTIKIDFTKYANIEALGDGEAKQKLRKLEDDLQVAEKELGQATTALEGTRRLFSKGYVPKTEITRDEISFESARLKVQTAETARGLYLKYEFPRSAEEWLSKYAESVRELDKARRVAISKLAQAKARLNSARGQYQVQLRQRNDLNDQLEKCTMPALKSGLVVYGGARDDGIYYGGQEPIREGASVRERQAIITIPDLKRMAVNVKIHESYIKKIQKGQKAKITVDAFPDKQLVGEITKVGVLPDSQNRWMNPDMKVYNTTITIDGSHDWVKPGMSTKVEIMITHLDDVVYVPVQSVVPGDGKQYCYVTDGFGHERREVETGEFSDSFIEIKKGLREGERVMLRPPEAIETEQAPEQQKPADSEPKEATTLAKEPAQPGKT